MKIRIMTDSASDIVNDKRNNLTVLPMVVSFGEQEYFDGVTLSHEDFFEKLTANEALPTTSQITPYRFSEAFEEATARGEQVVLITISAKLSGTWENAVIAAADYPDQVWVVDSENATVGQRALVEYALRLSDEGLSAPQIAAALEAAKPRLHLFAMLDTLEYLKRGGRISKVTALAGGLLSIKPVVTVQDGAVEVIGKARGMTNGYVQVTEKIAGVGGVDFSMPYYLGYAGADDHMLRAYISQNAALWPADTEALPVMSVGCAIGTHVGPHAFAIAFFAKE